MESLAGELMALMLELLPWRLSLALVLNGCAVWAADSWASRAPDSAVRPWATAAAFALLLAIDLHLFTRSGRTPRAPADRRGHASGRR